MNSDYHCHTKYSDGKNSIEDMVGAAINIGLKTFAITDHVRRDTGWISDYITEIEKLKKKYDDKIKILSGFEAKILDFYGNLDAKEEWYDLVDIVQGAIHSIPSHNGFLPREEMGNKEKIVSCWEKSIVGLMKNKRIDIIAHPFSELKDYNIDLTENIEDVFSSLISGKRKMVEISLRHNVPSARLIKRLVERRINLVIGSDAHSVEELYWYHEKKKQLAIESL